ncbi:hypothetical protein M9H77_03407 [Catharanthus roseus]|uniref:Uncharacterized protein n=1 Tax=Catharanthus roseus TaxID=4058 RepID=A0ACC0CBC4_CATRO|nr:hypothetical protein M9H77_03407 [Catharanthus roseus]
MGVVLIPNELNEDLALAYSSNAQADMAGSTSFSSGDAGARPTSLSNGAEEHNSQGRAAENSFETSHLPQVMTALDVSQGAIGTPNLPSHNSQPSPYSTSTQNFRSPNSQLAPGSTGTLNPPSHTSQSTPHEGSNEQNETSNEAQVSETNVIPRLCSSPNVQITSEVTKSWKSKFDDTCVQWRRVPFPVRDMWFDRFLKKFSWELLKDATIRDSFEKIVSRSLSSILNKTKHLESDGHKKLSQINKVDRMKEDFPSSPSSHWGCSISTTKKIRKLVNFYINFYELMLCFSL